MKKLFINAIILCLALCVFSAQVFAAASAGIKINLTDDPKGDGTVWKFLEDTLAEGQVEHPAIDGGKCLGWYAVGNVIQITHEIDFKYGLKSVECDTASNQPAGYFKTNEPDAKFNLRVNSEDGPVIAEIYPESAGSFTAVVPAASYVITPDGENLTGVHKLFVEQAGTGAKINLGNFTLYMDETPKPTTAAVSNTANTAGNLRNTILNDPSDDPDNSGGLDPLVIIAIIAGVVIVGAVVTAVVIRKNKK